MQMSEEEEHSYETTNQNPSVNEYIIFPFFTGLRDNPTVLLPEHRGAERAEAQPAPLAGQPELEPGRRRRGGRAGRARRVPAARQCQRKEELPQRVLNELNARPCNFFMPH